MTVGSYNVAKNFKVTPEIVDIALDNCKRNMDPSLGVVIYKIGMEDPAESERSINFQFSVDETAEILKTVKKVLSKRG